MPLSFANPDRFANDSSTIEGQTQTGNGKHTRWKGSFTATTISLNHFCTAACIQPCACRSRPPHATNEGLFTLQLRCLCIIMAHQWTTPPASLISCPAPAHAPCRRPSHRHLRPLLWRCRSLLPTQTSPPRPARRSPAAPHTAQPPCSKETSSKSGRSVEHEADAGVSLPTG